MYRVGRHHLQQQDLRGMWTLQYLYTARTDVSQANAGDSRTVLGIKGRAKPLSYDHKPQNEGT